MKRKLGSFFSPRNKKIACTVSAAALMLGVSSAATVGLHFQCNYYCSATRTAYSGTVVTLPAFGIQPNGWENLTATPSGYSGGACAFMVPGFTLEEIIDTTTSTNGLNPLPNGSLDVTWFANSANSDFFAGYAASPPHYTIGGTLNLNNPITGEHEIYFTFLRDGINFGPENDALNGGADNPLKDYYTVDITGLKSLFTNTPFVIELVAGSDSMQLLTNAFITDVDDSITNSVTYPGTPPGYNQGQAPWWRGSGGGLSTASGVFTNVDHIHINSNIPQHGGTGAPPASFDNAGTISGFIITDKPVVSMHPQSIPLAGPGDTVQLSAYAIGVPPLSYQWQFDGQNIPGATTLTNTFTATEATAGSYALVVTNLYGSTTSQVSTVVVDKIVESPTASNNIIFDSQTANAQHDGINLGATWLASSTDSASVTKTGVMSFNAVLTNGIEVPANAAYNGTTSTVTFWMRSAGTDTNDVVTEPLGAAIFQRPGSSAGTGMLLMQQDTANGNALQFIAGGNNFVGTTTPSDNKWHFVAVTFNTTTNGGAAIFLDGSLQGTNNGNGISGFSYNTSEPIEIGYDSYGYWRNYNGLLHDVRFYSTILSSAELSSVQGGAVADATDLQFDYQFATAPGEGLILSWLETTATLESATNLLGPWAPATGAVSPYTIVPNVNQQFFRYVNTNAPVVRVSNPYLM